MAPSKFWFFLKRLALYFYSVHLSFLTIIKFLVIFTVDDNDETVNLNAAHSL